MLSLVAGAAILGCASVAMAQTAAYPHRHAVVGVNANATSTANVTSMAPTKTAAANEFASEAEAKAHCPSDTIVWVNTKTHVYHFAGAPAYGHTKHGAFMCAADASRVGSFHAAKNEKPVGR
jgi:hypothetical protein